MRVLFLVFAIAILMPFGASADGPRDYVGFAKKADGGSADVRTCRSYGGQLVVDGHYHTVMRMGRRDERRTNLIYHGGHQYVAFTITKSTFWGSKEYIEALCHFAG